MKAFISTSLDAEKGPDSMMPVASGGGGNLGLALAFPFLTQVTFSLELSLKELNKVMLRGK